MSNRFQHDHTPAAIGIPEEWRPVPGFPWIELSSLGRARYTWTPKVNGTKYAELRIEGVKKSFHVWMALTFLGPCPEGFIVDHKDTDKANNKPDNLQYVTYAGNNRKGKRVKLTLEQARRIRSLASSGVRNVDLARQFNTHQSSISFIISHKIWREDVAHKTKK